MPHSRQKAIGKPGLIVVFPRGLVTLSATNSKLNVRMASMHVPCAAVSPGDNVNVGTVMFAGFKLRVVNAQNSHSNGKTVSLVASLYNQIA